LHFFYSLLLRCAAPFAFAVVLWRGFNDRGYWQGLGERFGFGQRLASENLAGEAPAAEGSIWLHAVSLGEVTAAAPLIRGIQAQYSHIPLVVTTSTPAGRERAFALFGGGVDIRFLPYDTPGSVRRFFARTQPRLAVILETELWPNLFKRCRISGVPLLLVNARLSDKSVSRYQRLDRIFNGLVRGLFSENVFVAAQSASDAERFRAIGASPAQTSVAGNIKFDVHSDEDSASQGRALRRGFSAGSLGGERAVWIAGSTHAGEDELVLTAHAALLGKMPDALLLLVPRHKVRFAAVAALIESCGLAFVRRSSGAAATAETRVILVDTLGELSMLYAAADVAFVGGSLVPVGGHNLLEPAALGLPVLTGPSHSNSKEVAQLLLQSGAAVEVADAAGLEGAVYRLLRDAAERRRIATLTKDLIAANRGSVGRLLDLVKSRLESSSP
jgi:3-deoxy-D-manno-octulosonic-acid transferase